MTTTSLKIVRDTAGRFWRVRETGTPDLEHVWLGVEVKRQPSKSAVFPAPLFVAKTSREILVRKAGCTVVEG